jgi:hypothetical protein
MTSEALLDAWFWSRIQPLESGCWEWTGTRWRDGYGAIRLDGRQQRAHRIIYELLVGPIPAGLVPDHLCRNHWCVNPLHIEPVTNRENTKRGYRARGYDIRCAKGHLFTEANIYWRKDRAHPVRECVACRLAAKNRQRARDRQRRGALNSTIRLGQLESAL